MKLFAKVELKETSREETVMILENVAEKLERSARAIVTYSALEAIYELSDRFVAEGSMPEKAIDLLDRAISTFRSGGRFILPEDIERIIEESTKIPVGKAGEVMAGERGAHAGIDADEEHVHTGMDPVA